MQIETTQNETPATAAAGADVSTRPRLLDWIFTVPFLVAFGLSLAVFDPIQRLARLFGPRPHEIVVGVLTRPRGAVFPVSVQFVRTNVRQDVVEGVELAWYESIGWKGAG